MRTIHSVDPRLVRAFVAVVEQGAFRRAAGELGVSKSAVSEQVALLEEHLGVRLLARTTRSVKLTDAGQNYYQIVSQALRSLGEAERIVRQSSSQPRGRLRMSAPNELGQILFGGLLASYTARYPDVVLEVDLTDRRVNLIDEGFDLVMRIGPLQNSALVARKLGKPIHVGVYASPAYLEMNGTPSEPRDLVGHRCMAMTGTSAPLQWPFRRKGKAEVVNIAPCISVNSDRVLAELAVAGVGLTRLPELHARAHMSRGQLVEVLGAFAADPPGPFAVYPSGRVSPAVRAMVDLWLEYFRERQPCQPEGP
jgi:DNA-binding transcriptional LysR family regulator